MAHEIKRSYAMLINIKHDMKKEQLSIISIVALNSDGINTGMEHIFTTCNQGAHQTSKVES